MNIKEIFISICCFLSFAVSLITIMVTTSEMEQVKKENKYLEIKVEQQNDVIAENEKAVEKYKQYVDDVARCIIDGEW